MHVPYNNIAKCLLRQAPICIFFFFFTHMLSFTSLFQSSMQVDDTGGSPVPNTLSPMPPPVSLALSARAIPISYFPVSLFSRSSLLFLTLIYFLSLLLHLCPLLVLTAVLPRKVYSPFPFVFLLSKLSFYSSHYLSYYLGLLQVEYLRSKLHALLLLSPYY